MTKESTFLDAHFPLMYTLVVHSITWVEIPLRNSGKFSHLFLKKLCVNQEKNVHVYGKLPPLSPYEIVSPLVRLSGGGLQKLIKPEEGLRVGGDVL